MARNAPNPSEKFLYFFMIVLGISILYIDINTLNLLSDNITFLCGSLRGTNQ